MANTFWDSKGVVLVDFVEGQKMVTSSYYESVLKMLKTYLTENGAGKGIVKFCFIMTMPVHILQELSGLCCANLHGKHSYTPYSREIGRAHV